MKLKGKGKRGLQTCLIWGAVLPVQQKGVVRGKKKKGWIHTVFAQQIYMRIKELAQLTPRSHKKVRNFPRTHG